MKLEFAKFLTEEPLGAPAALPPAPGGGMGGPPPPPGGMGGPPMPPPMGGMGGPPQPGQQQGPKELKKTDVWGVLEELLGISNNKTSKKTQTKIESPHQNHLMK